MGMSQEEIDSLMSEVNSTDSNAGKSAVPGANIDSLQKIADLFIEATANLIPILISSSEPEVTPETPGSGKSGTILPNFATDSVLLTFNIPALTSSSFVAVIDRGMALYISKKMMGQDEIDELNEVLLSALNEAVNNILGALDSSLNEAFGIQAEHSDIKFSDLKNPIPQIETQTGIKPDTEIGLVTFTVKADDISGRFGLILDTAGMNEIREKIMPPEPIKPIEKEIQPKAPSVDKQASEPSGKEEQKIDTKQPLPEISKAQFEQLEPGKASGPMKGVDLILDVPLQVTVELGRKQLSVREILELSPGSLVELEKLAGETVDLLVNGKLFARGEVVVIDENFGVRVSSIITPKERLENMK